MKKDIKFWLLIVIVAILMTIISVFVVYKYHIYEANVDANSIEVGDNEDLEETNTEDIENIKINEADLIGKLTIPDILLKDAPIKEGTELDILSDSIGPFKSTSLDSGNDGLASHNSGGKGDYFKNLKNIKVGSEIFYQTKYGVKRYIVETKKVIDETDFSYLKSTEDNRITLITCVAGKKDKRLCIQAIENYENMDYGQ